MALGRAFAAVGGMTMGSRVLGLVREMLIAAFLGASDAADAFYAAFRFPNMFRRLFAEGAFSMAFVPLYARRMEGGRERAFAEEAQALLAASVIGVCVIASLAMPVLIYGVAAGFAETPGKKDLAVLVARLCFPYLAFVSLAALYTAMLNALGRFAVAAGAPMLLNVFMIAAILGGDFLDWPIAPTLAAAATLSGAAQLGLVVWEARRAGLRLTPRFPRLTPDMRRLLVLAAPAAISGGVMQINLVIGSLVASFYDGAVSWLSYADRLYQLPLGVVGIAVGVVLLPDLSRRARDGDGDGARAALNRAVEFALVLTLPAAMALLVIPHEVVGVLFGRGAFGAADVEATAAALMLFALGLPAYVLNKALTPAYFAREDTRTPLRYAMIAMAANSALSVAGSLAFGWLAIPLATAVAAWLNVWLLRRGMARLGDYGMDDRLRRRLPRLGLACLAMGAGLALVAALFEGVTGGWRFGALLVLVLGGAGLYFGAAQALGGFSLGEVRLALRRQRRDA